MQVHRVHLFKNGVHVLALCGRVLDRVASHKADVHIGDVLGMVNGYFNVFGGLVVTKQPLLNVLLAVIVVRQAL